MTEFTYSGFFLLLLTIIIALLTVLLLAALLTWFERKVIASIQLRRGPNVVGPFGILQPLADGLKILTKETIIPSNANRVAFIVAPIITFTLALSAWAVIPIDYGLVIADINVGILYLFAISSLAVYGIIIGGWASNSRYAFLGAMRSVAQMISYEISIGFVLIAVLILVNSLNLTDIVSAQEDLWFFIPLFPLFIMFIILALAESNRTPFDLPEAEAELVAGYHVEYSAMSFAFYFLGEYVNMILLSTMCVILFLGGWLAPFDIFPFNFIAAPIWFFIKICAILFIFLWVRASLPRYRYDQLMRLSWKVFLPLSLVAVVLTASYAVFVR